MTHTTRQRIGGRGRALLLAAAATALLGAAAAPAVAAPAVGHLTTEHLTDPLGIDAAQPRLAWSVDAAARGATQRAYRVLVATTAAKLDAGVGDVWDSGEVASATSFEAAYAGPALTASTEYLWKVEVFLTGVSTGTWSDAASFETGLLGDAGWGASTWIGTADTGLSDANVDLTGTSWIWHPDNTEGTAEPAEPRYFRRVITIPAGRTVDDAQVVAAADDNFTLYVNGTEIGSSPAKTNSWHNALRYRIPLKTGKNVIAFIGFNTVASSGGTSAGLVARAKAVLDNGTVMTAETGDSGWHTSATAPDDWNTAGYDDSAWPVARTITAFGSGPWGTSVVLPSPLAGQRPAGLLLRRDFATSKTVTRARLSVATGGLSTVTIDGKPVNDHVLDPVFTDPTKRVPYVTSDVTSLVAPGQHTLGVRLGFGLFDVDQQSVWNWDVAPWRDSPRIRALLDVDYSDGTHDQILSDGSWKLHTGPTLADSPYGGESYDARLASTGWDQPGYDETGWEPVDTLNAPGGTLTAQAEEPMRVTETLPATSVQRITQGNWLVSFARPVSGWVKLHLTAPAGTTMTLKYGERLAGSRVSFANSGVVGTAQTDTYVFSGDPAGETWTPQFSSKGFQYVEINGFPGTPTAADFTAQVVHSDVDRIGAFSSSSPALDALHARSVDTLLNNLQGIPTGTPAYDKTGATGAAQLTAESSLFNLATTAVQEQWLDDVTDTISADGVPGQIAPSPGSAADDPAPTWGSALVLTPWTLYRQRGDTRVLSDHYDAMAAYLRHELARQSGGLSTDAYGDWGAPDATNDVSPEDSRVAGTAYVFLMAKTMASIATVLGHDSDAASFTASAQAIADAFNAAFFDSAQGVYTSPLDPAGVYRESHNVLALAFGLVPAADQARVAASIAADVRARGVHLDTGALSSKELLPVLTEYGYGDVAYQLATQTDGPSWGAWLAGDTTSQGSELWSSSRSVDNALLTTADDWLWQDVAGLQATGPGYARFDVAPHIVGDLTHAAAATQTPRGRAAVDWTRDGDVLRLAVTVPVGAVARVHLPLAAGGIEEGGVPIARAAGVTAAGTDADGQPVYEVGAGTYAFATGQPVATTPSTPSTPSTSPSSTPVDAGTTPAPASSSPAPAAGAPSTPSTSAPTAGKAAAPRIACAAASKTVQHKRTRVLRCTITVAGKATLRATAKRGKRTVASGRADGRLVLTIPGATPATLRVTATPRGAKVGPLTRTVTKKVAAT